MTFLRIVSFSPSNDHAHRQRSHFHHSHHSCYNHYNHSQPNQHFNWTQQPHHSNRGYQPTTSNTDFFHQGSRPSLNKQQRDPLLPHPPHPVTQSLPARRAIATITCFKCNAQGHYANNCQSPQSFGARSKAQYIQSQQQSAQAQPQVPQSQSQTRPSSNNSGPTRGNTQAPKPVRVVSSNSDDTNSFDTEFLNDHNLNDSFIV